MNDLVLYEVKDRIGYITLNRPEKRNALSAELVESFKLIFKQAENDTNCKIIVITGNGEAFCAGADLGYIQNLGSFSDKENLEDSFRLRDLFLDIYNSSKIVIAKVNGPALAGGCGIAGLCDFIYAADSATFGYTEARIGFIPAMVMVFLLKKTEGKTAKQLLLSAEIISAQNALNLNLINAIFDRNILEEEVHKLAIKLSKGVSAQSVSIIKEMLRTTSEMPFNDAMTYAAEMNVKARKSEDCKKGISSFLNKEKLSW